MIDRVGHRLAACWPEQVDCEALRREAGEMLLRAAACVGRVECLAQEAALAIDERMRDRLIAGEWYRQAMLRRVRPLCDAWRGALIAGRRPTDRVLCSRLHIGTGEIAGLFAEAAVVFLVDPTALLPAGVDARYGMAQVLVELPADQQLATALYFEQHLTIPEIAHAMVIQPLAAQELLGRAGICIVAHAGLADWVGGRGVSA